MHHFMTGKFIFTVFLKSLVQTCSDLKHREVMGTNCF